MALLRHLLENYVHKRYTPIGLPNVTSVVLHMFLTTGIYWLVSSDSPTSVHGQQSRAPPQHPLEARSRRRLHERGTSVAKEEHHPFQFPSRQPCERPRLYGASFTQHHEPKTRERKQVQVDDYRSKHGTTRKYRRRRNRSSSNIAAVRTCDSFRFSGSSVPVITLQIRDRPGSPRRRTSSTSSRRHAFNRLLRRCVPLVAAWAPVFVDSVFLIGFVIFDAPSARTNWFPSSQARMLFLWLSSRTSGPHNRFSGRNRSRSRTATSASPVFGTPTKGSAAWESSVACTRAYALHFTAAAAES